MFGLEGAQTLRRANCHSPSSLFSEPRQRGRIVNSAQNPSKRTFHSFRNGFFIARSRYKRRTIYQFLHSSRTVLQSTMRFFLFTLLAALLFIAHSNAVSLPVLDLLITSESSRSSLLSARRAFSRRSSPSEISQVSESSEFGILSGVWMFPLSVALLDTLTSRGETAMLAVSLLMRKISSREESIRVLDFL